MYNRKVAQRTMQVNFYNQKYLIEHLLKGTLSDSSTIINMSSKMATPIMVRNKEIRKQILGLPSNDELEALSRKFIRNKDPHLSWIAPRNPVPDYMFSKLLFRIYTINLGKYDEEVAKKGIKVCSLCPGWVRTAMGGEQASFSVEQAVEGFQGLLSGEFFSGRKMEDFQGKLISDHKILEFK